MFRNRQHSFRSKERTESLPPPHATQKRVREDCDFRHRLKNFEENSFAWRVETDTRRFLRVGFYCRIGNGTNAKMLDKVYNKKGARNRK